MNKIHKRLIELSSLKDGWFGGSQGKQLDKDGISWLVNILSYYDFRDKIPVISPTIDGNVEMEWRIGGDSIITLFVVLDRKTIFYNEIYTNPNMIYDEGISFEIKGDEISSWDKLDTFYRQLYKYNNGPRFCYKCLNDDEWRYNYKPENHPINRSYFSNKSITKINILSSFFNSLWCYNNFLKELNMNNYLRLLVCDNIKVLGFNSPQGMDLTFKC